MRGPLPSHTYEGLRDVVVEVLLAAPRNGVNQFVALLENVGLVFGQREAALGQGPLPPYPGTISLLSTEDKDTILEIVWDLFRQGIVTLGSDAHNSGWPWLKLSRFGRKTLAEGGPHRFHETQGYLKLVKAQAPDVSEEALIYLEEAAASFYAGCLLASCVMLGVAAEAEFLRLLNIALVNEELTPRFSAAARERAVSQKIEKFKAALKSLVGTTLSRNDVENLDTHLSAIQTVIRVARNDAGHPTGAAILERDQVYVHLHLFIPFAKEIMKLRHALGEAAKPA